MLFIADANVGACLFGFQLLKSPLVALIVAGVYRCLLICFGVYYWYEKTASWVRILFMFPEVVVRYTVYIEARD